MYRNQSGKVVIFHTDFWKVSHLGGWLDQRKFYYLHDGEDVELVGVEVGEVTAEELRDAIRNTCDCCDAVDVYRDDGHGLCLFAIMDAYYTYEDGGAEIKHRAATEPATS